MDDNTKVKIHALEQSVESLKQKLVQVRKEAELNKKLVTSATKELNILKTQLKQLNTRMISNENDIRHIGSKR